MTLLLCRSVKFVMIVMHWSWNCMLPLMITEKSLGGKGVLPKPCGLSCELAAHVKVVIPRSRFFRERRERHADVNENRMGYYRNNSGPFWHSRGTQSSFAHRYTE